MVQGMSSSSQLLPVGAEELEDIPETTDDITDTQLELLQIRQLQDTIRELRENVGDEDEPFKLMHASPKELKKIAFIATRIHDKADGYELERLQSQCEDLVSALGGIIKTTDGDHVEEPLKDLDVPEWVLSDFTPLNIRYRLQNLPVAETSAIAKQL